MCPKDIETFCGATQKCEGSCNSNGYCMSSRCRCFDGFSGLDCSYEDENHAMSTVFNPGEDIILESESEIGEDDIFVVADFEEIWNQFIHNSDDLPWRRTNWDVHSGTVSFMSNRATGNL